MFHKDTFRLIKSTFNRFFSLFMIVVIGVAFMMGLLSSRPIMEESVEQYYSEMNLQDFQIYSSYGFNDDDIKAIEKQEYVRECFGSRMTDVFCRNENGDVFVIRLEELDRKMNKFELLAGRLPQKDNELVLVSSSLNHDSDRLIGSEIEVYLDDSDITDTLVNTTYKIVGIVKTPSYMAKTMGTSNLKNLELNEVAYIPNSNFLSDYYTTVYVTVNDADGLNSFKEEYKEFIGEYEEDLRIFANRQQEVLKSTLLDEYRDKIAEGERELNIRKAEGQKQLDEAKQKLDDAKIQIIAGETQLETMRSALATAEGRIKSLQRQYDSDNSRINSRISEIESKDARGRSFEQIMAEASMDYATYNALKRMKSAAGSNQYQDNIDRIRQENADRRNRLDNVLYPERDSLNSIINSETASAEEKEAAISRLSEVNSEISQLENEIVINDALISNLEELGNQNTPSDIDTQIEEIDRKYNGSIDSVYISYLSLAQEQLRVATTAEEIRIAQEALNRVTAEITSGSAEIERGKAEYALGEKQYLDAVITFNEEIEKAEAEIRKAYQDLDELPDAKWIILNRDSHYSSYMYANNCKQMGAIGFYMPILFYLVAALVCMTTMTRLVDEQRGQIGIFRALGFSKNEVISKYIIYALLASVTGSVVGIISGMLIFPVVIYETWRLMYDLPTRITMFPITNIIVCILAFTVLMSAVTYFVVRKTLNETPSQLLRPKAPKNAKKVFIENIPFIWNRLSFTSKITARNLIRYKTRFFMTVIGVAGCTSLLVLGWGIKDSISDVIGIQFGQIYNYNYVVNLENDHNLAQIQNILENDLSNEYVAPIMSYSAKMYKDTGEKVLTVEVVDARKGNDIFNLREKDHKTPVRIGNNGVIITEKFADLNKIKAGDYITIESRNGIKRQVKVAEVCEMYFQHYAYISEEYYDAVFNEPIHPNSIAVKTDNSDNLYSTIEDVEGVESIVDFSSVVSQFNIMIEALDYIILVIIITAGSLAFVVLINLTQVNISERIREIATLKVLGFRNVEIDSYIFKEIMTLAIIGGVFGLPLGIVEHRFIMGVIDMEMIRFGTNVKTLSFIYAYAITIVFTIIVLYFTRKPLQKIQMIESLKSVE